MKKSKNCLLPKQRVHLEVFLLLVIFIFGCLLRYVVYTQASWWPADLGEIYFIDAKVTTNALQLSDTTYVFRLYMLYLHTICMFFGNIYEICLFAHFIMFVITNLVWYFVVKKLFNWIVSLVLTAICFLAPVSILLSCTLNPFVMWFLLFGIVLFIIVSCIKWLLKNNTKEKSPLQASSEPIVTIVDFDNEKAVIVPKEEEKPAIFIPKSMDTPKRIAKPKVDFTVSVTDEKLCYDVEVSEQDDYDLS